MVTNDRRFFWISEAVLGVLVLLTIAVMFSGKGEKDKIAVIVRNSDAEKWTQFISGVKTAASDAGADIVIASTGGFSTLADEGALIQQEIRSGADALILQPVPGEDEKELLQKAISGVPVILVHSDLVEQETEEAGFPVIKADNYAMGEALAQMLLEDYAGTLEGKTIGIVNDRLKSEAAVSREKGLLDALEGTGCSILWTLYTDNESADIDLAVSAKKKADLVLALGTEQLEGAGAAEEEREIHGALVYGIAASEKALYYLDHDNVRGLVIPNGFDMGYQSVMQVVRKLKHPFFRMRDQEVSFRCVRKGDLFTEDNEGLLFGADS